MGWGRRAIGLLIEYAGELEFRPDDRKLVTKGRALVKVDNDLALFLRSRAHGRKVMLGKERARARREEVVRRPAEAIDRVCPKYGFRRGPKAGG
jgi:hypothetical protein